MNKIIIALVVVAAIGTGWFLLTASNTYDYVADVDSEITELENELASLDAQVAAGTLNEEQATAAKVRIVNRLNTINDASNQSENTKLTPAQRTQFIAQLDRLKTILIKYQNTLATVEAAADDTQVQARVRRGGSVNHNRPLNLIVADVIADVEETVTDSVQDYEPDTNLDEAIDEVIEEAEAEVIAEEEAEMTNGEDTSTSTDEAIDSEMDDMESDMGDDMGIMDAAAEVDAESEVSADADLEATTTN